jgi:hypothetical protein
MLQMIELFIKQIKYDLNVKECPEFTFRGFVMPFDQAQLILDHIKANPQDTKLKFFI